MVGRDLALGHESKMVGHQNIFILDNGQWILETMDFDKNVIIINYQIIINYKIRMLILDDGLL